LDNELTTRVPTAAATNVTVTGEVEPGANSNKCYNTWALCRGVSARVNPEEGTFSLPGVPLYPGTNVLVVLVRDVSGNDAEQIRTVVRTNALKTFEYDGNGNLTNWVKAGENSVYEWDWADRLVKMESRPGTPQGSWRGVERQYDVMSRRIRQTAWTWLVQSNLWVVTEDLKFLSDPLLFGRHLVDLNASNNVAVRTYVWGLDLSETLEGVGGVGGLLWVTLHTASGPTACTHICAYDGNRNILALAAASDGSVSARYEYGPFGEAIRVSGPAAALNPFRFSTKRTEPTNDLVLYEYRAYNPIIGRWLSRDPINDPGLKLLIRSQYQYNWDEEKNLYGFVHNDPMNRHDPRGLDCIWDPNIPTPQRPRVPDDVPDKAKECLSAPDLPSSSPECDKYGNRTYYGANLSCFCKCAGDSPWSKTVRGCLRCMDEKGIPVGDVHAYCYIAADAKQLRRPWCTLAKCLCKCQ